MSTDNQQWIHAATLTVGGVNGKGIAITADDLRFTFSVTSATGQTLQRLEARIYNLSRETAQRFEREFVQVQLDAGYKSTGTSTIFTGGISQIRRGRESETDTYVDVIAVHQDRAYNYGTINSSIAAGWNQALQHTTLTNALGKYGVTKGTTPTFSTTAMPRGKVMYGMCRDQLRDLAKASGSQWYLASNILHVLPFSQAQSQKVDVIVLSPTSGLIGIPEKTIDGLNVRALLNPQITLGRLIQVDTSLINTTTIRTPFAKEDYIPDTSLNGIYKVYSLRYVGDTRGDVWFTEAVCEALNPENGNAVNSDLRRQAVNP